MQHRMSPRVVRWVSGLAASGAMVVAVTGVVAVLKPYVPVLSLLVLYLLAVLPVAVVWGAGLAALTSVLSVIVFTVFLRPAGSVWVADSRNLAALAVFVLTAVVVSELAARSRRAAVESAHLIVEQSALRRVATLVAQAVQPVAVFEAVTREVGLLSGADLARMERYEVDGTVTGVGGWSRVPDQLAVGTRFDLDGLSVARDVRQTDGPVRLETFAGATGGIAREAHELGIRSSVGCPIVVAGQLWGVIAASTTSDEPFPVRTESQMARFTELVATAVENAEARAELRRVADEQAVLRRVATLVARGVAPEPVFAAVAEEVGQLTDADAAGILRFDADGMGTLVALWGMSDDDGLGVGARWKPEPPTPTGAVLATGHSARYDADSQALGDQPALLRDRRIRSAVASPITVEGRRWGAISVASRDRPFPPDTERRMAEFTEIVALAIANAESRVQLAASRARVVAAGDRTRRQIERDLHDGAQQRLVSLALDLRLAQDTVPEELPALRAGIGRAADGLTEVQEELREMSRGIHPATLSEGGLGPALRTLARRSAIPVEVHVDTGSRYPPAVEVAAYYVVSEALTNTAKHAGPSPAEVVVEEWDATLRVRVSDEGVGGAEPRRGSGLIGLRDRVEAVGGSIDVISPVGRGTTIQVSLPLQPTDAGDMA
jgi:signal transduction histidine kinase